VARLAVRLPQASVKDVAAQLNQAAGGPLLSSSLLAGAAGSNEKGGSRGGGAGAAGGMGFTGSVLQYGEKGAERDLKEEEDELL